MASPSRSWARPVGVSQCVIAYYERADAQPPGAMLGSLAQALHVSVEEVLGTSQVADKTRPRTARLLKRLRKIEDLPAGDQRTVLKLLDALHAARARTSGTRARARANAQGS